MLATARPQQRRQDITPTKAGPEDTSGKAPHGARKAPPQSGARKRIRTDDDDGDVVDTPRSPACNKNSRGCGSTQPRRRHERARDFGYALNAGLARQNWSSKRALRPTLQDRKT